MISRPDREGKVMDTHVSVCTEFIGPSTARLFVCTAAIPGSIVLNRDLFRVTVAERAVPDFLEAMMGSVLVPVFEILSIRQPNWIEEISWLSLFRNHRIMEIDCTVSLDSKEVKYVQHQTHQSSSTKIGAHTILGTSPLINFLTIAKLP